MVTRKTIFGVIIVVAAVVLVVFAVVAGADTVRDAEPKSKMIYGDETLDTLIYGNEESNDKICTNEQETAKCNEIVSANMQAENIEANETLGY